MNLEFYDSGTPTLDFFLKGLFMGFTVAAIIGPIGLLCIQRTLNKGFKLGLLTGLGAAIADSIYGLIAALGLATVASFLIDYQGMIAGIGSLFLFWLAWAAWKSSVPKLQPEFEKTKINSIEKRGPLFYSFGSSFLLTLSNPLTILSFTAIFASFGMVGSATGYQPALLLVTGVFLGSMIWWFILSGVVEIARERISDKIFLMINRSSGILLFCFGIYAFGSAGYQMILQL